MSADIALMAIFISVRAVLRYESESERLRGCLTVRLRRCVLGNQAFDILDDVLSRELR